MTNRISTLLREIALDCGKYKRLTRNEKAIVDKNQERILYENNPELYKTCIVCDKKCSKKNDHFVSAVFNKNARFRNGKILATEHPMNKVYCCSGKCNNETNKKYAMDTKPRLKAYYDYVLQNIPTNNCTEEQFAKIYKHSTESELKRISLCQETYREISSES